MSCVEFCNREGLAYSTFCRWRDKLVGKSERNVDNQHGEVVSEADDDVTGKASVDEVKFVAAGVISDDGKYVAEIEIRFSSDISVNVRNRRT